MEKALFLPLFFVALGIVAASRQTTRFLVIPEQVVYKDKGSDVTFEWDFHVESRSPSGTKIYKFLFGEWAFPGYVKNPYLNVQGVNKVNKRHGYEKKVDWIGNIYRSPNFTAKVTMYNLTLADFKTYGVVIDLGLRRPLKNWLILAQRVPAKIISFQTNLEVGEGNTTTIECQAEGRPSPFVKIEKDNRTLCNDTERCVHTIQGAKPEHDGEYVCLAQQGNASEVRRSMQLKVHQGGEASHPLDQVEQPTNNATPSTKMLPKEIVVVLVLAIVSLLIALVMFAIAIAIANAHCYKAKKHYRFDAKGKHCFKI